MNIDDGGMTGQLPLQQLDGVDTFSNVPVKRETLLEIFEAVKNAPSLANSQPWEFIVTESSVLKREMANALLDVQFRPQSSSQDGLSWFIAAPVVVTIAMNRLRAKAKVGPEGADRFGLVDIGGALIYLLHLGAERGLGGTIIREFDRQMIRETLSLPAHVDPVLLVVLGYRVERPKNRPHLHVEEYVHWQTWTTHIQGEE